MNCGLIFVHEYEQKAVPLTSVRVEATVRGFVSDVRATMSYRNAEAFPVEASFVFPLDADAAVHAFRARLAGRHIHAVVKERQQAKDEYDDAVSGGHTAFLLEEDREDIFQCTLGNLGAGEEAELELELVSELSVETDGAVRFCLPAVLNPRYTPAGSHEASALASVPFVRGAPSQPLPYTLAFHLRAENPAGVTRISSPCQLSAVSYSGPEKSVAEVSLEEGFTFDRDVEVFIYSAEKHLPFALLERGDPSKGTSFMGGTVAMLNFLPGLGESEEGSKAGRGASELTQRGEFVFVVDCSGSMDCPLVDTGDGARQSRIEAAKEALMLLLKSLPLGCFFNVYAFGSFFNSFFPESKEYNQQSMEEALAKVKNMSAEMGGTEILQPLEKIYNMPCRPEHPRQLMVLTDGEVSNTLEVINLVKMHASKHRCFSFGIGDGASTELIKGIAAGGGGVADFITGAERLQGKVMKALRCALQPTLSSVSLSWSLPPGASAVVVPEIPGNIFLGQRTIVYAQITGTTPAEPWQGEAVLRYSLRDEPVENRVPISSQPADPDSRCTLHWLAAKALIRHLSSGLPAPGSGSAAPGSEQPSEPSVEQKLREEERRSRRERVVALSVETAVVSPFTAFVGVDAQSQQPQGAAMQARPTPRRQAFGAGPRCMMRTAAMPPPMACFYGSPMMMCDANMDVVDSAAPPVMGRMGVPLACPASVGGQRRRQIRSSNAKSNAVSFSVEQAQVLCDAEMNFDDEAPAPPPAQLPFLELVGLQKAHGTWELSAKLAAVVGCSEEALRKEAPAGLSDEVWATLLALLWLHGRASEYRDEWELLGTKAWAWLRQQPGVDIHVSLQAANQLLKTSVDAGDL